jgi:integrase
MVRAGKLCCPEWKGRNKQKKNHELPVLPPVRASIDAWRAAHPGEGHLVWLVSEWGAPYAATDTLAAWFRRQCRYAGITAWLSPERLRKLAAVRCVEAGASELELMAIFCWTTPKQADRYARQYRRQLAEARGARHLLGPGKAPSAEAQITLFAANQK